MSPLYRQGDIFTEPRRSGLGATVVGALQGMQEGKELGRQEARKDLQTLIENPRLLRQVDRDKLQSELKKAGMDLTATAFEGERTQPSAGLLSTLTQSGKDTKVKVNVGPGGVIEGATVTKKPRKQADISVNDMELYAALKKVQQGERSFIGTLKDFFTPGPTTYETAERMVGTPGGKRFIQQVEGGVSKTSSLKDIQTKIGSLSDRAKNVLEKKVDGLKPDNIAQEDWDAATLSQKIEFVIGE